MPRKAIPETSELLARELQLQRVEIGRQYEALLEANAELERSRQHYLELFELSPVGHLTLSPDTRIEEANQAAANLLGTTAREIQKTRFSKFLLAEHAIDFEKHRRAVLASDEPHGCELTLVTAKGTKRIVRLQSVCSGAMGSAWRMAMMDVTEVRRLQEQLHEAQRLEAIATFVGGVSHDFNNVLGVILGCTEIALKRLGSDSEARAAIERAKRVALRGATIVRKLAAFSKRDERAISVVTSFSAAWATIRPRLKSMLGNNVRIKVSLNIQNPFAVDTTELEQMFLCLAMNARDAMPYGGTWSIRGEDVEEAQVQRHFGGERHFGSGTLLTIADTGSGMDAETKARAFEPFFTTKPVGTGSGLGLSTVYGIVKHAGGHIQIDSRLGRGTTFRIFFPCPRAA